MNAYVQTFVILEFQPYFLPYSKSVEKRACFRYFKTVYSHTKTIEFMPCGDDMH